MDGRMECSNGEICIAIPEDGVLAQQQQGHQREQGHQRQPPTPTPTPTPMPTLVPLQQPTEAEQDLTDLIELLNGEEREGGIQYHQGMLPTLQVVDLSNRLDQYELPDSLGQLTSLRSLALRGCSKLNTLPASIGRLSALATLELAGCRALLSLPDNIGQLGSLQMLDLSGCSALEDLPDSIGQLGSLQMLDLSGCGALQQLPGSLGRLTSLCTLNLSNCGELQRLPDSIGQLGSLQAADMSGCSGLLWLPYSVGQLGALESLCLSGCSRMNQLPASVGLLSRLERLNLRDCSALQQLPDSLGHLTRLATLDLTGCSALQQLPDLGTCPHLKLSMEASAVPLGKFVIPLDFLPPKLQLLQPDFVFDQAEALQQSMSSISWIAILLATASFVGFIEVPGGVSSSGVVKVADPTAQTTLDVRGLRVYFVSNICTFFLALLTALYCVTENLPRASPPTAAYVVSVLITSSCLLVLTVLSGACTFLSGTFAVYPKVFYEQIIVPAAVFVPALFLMLGWYLRRVWQLVRAKRRADAELRKDIAAKFHVTSPDGTNLKVLKSIRSEIVHAIKKQC